MKNEKEFWSNYHKFALQQKKWFKGETKKKVSKQKKKEGGK